MSDSDGGMTLNLNFEGSSFKSKSKNKVSKNRKRRIQARRRQKNKNKKDESDTNKNLNKSNTFVKPSISKNNEDKSNENQTTKAKPVESSSNQNLNENSANKTEVSTKKVETSSVSKNVKHFENKKNSNFKKSFNSSAPAKTGKQKTSLFGGNPELPVVNTITKEKPVVVETNKTSFIELEEVGNELTSYLVDKMDFKSMTTVQRKSLPVLLSENNTDVLMRSPTGSGKTIAYSLAVVEKLRRKLGLCRNSGVYAVVIVPTRELALQTKQVFDQLVMRAKRIVPTCLIGGNKMSNEKRCIRKGVNVVIATPGRLADHMENTKCLNFSKVEFIVLDEADRLLDMGMQQKIDKILKTIRKQTECENVQTVLLSATLTKGVEKLVDLNLKDPYRVEADNTEDNKTLTTIDSGTKLTMDHASFPATLDQFVSIVPSKLRLVTLVSLLHKKCQEEKLKVVVFLSCRDSVHFHQKLFDKIVRNIMSWSASTQVLALHGGMEQAERTKTTNKFRLSPDSCILMCTDVAARGLDIPEVDMVIQYISPVNPVDYIHRVGRTARAGKEGKSVLFLTPAESKYIDKILEEFDMNLTELKYEQIFNDLVKSAKDKISPNLLKQLGGEKAAEIHNKIEEALNKDEELKPASMKAFMSFTKAYATYPTHLKFIFRVTNLHLGHVAKSFALQEEPKQMLERLRKCLGEAQVKQMKRVMDKPANRREAEMQKLLSKISTPAEEHAASRKGQYTKRSAAKHDPSSEFFSGIPASKKKKKN